MDGGYDCGPRSRVVRPIGHGEVAGHAAILEPQTTPEVCTLSSTKPGLPGSNGPIVVAGLDHTPRGAGALRYAARRAAAVDGCVRIIHVVPATEESDAGANEGSVAWVYELAKSIEDPPAMTIVIEAGEPAAILAQASADASALVVGMPNDPRQSVGDRILEKLRRSTFCLLIEVTADGDVVRTDPPAA